MDKLQKEQGLADLAESRQSGALTSIGAWLMVVGEKVSILRYIYVVYNFAILWPLQMGGGCFHCSLMSCRLGEWQPTTYQ
jgi:hypothetical protein